MLKRGWSRRLALSRVKSIEKEACRKAVAVLAVSSTDKDDLIRLYGIPEEKIHIVPNGTVLRELPSSAAKEAARRTLGLGKETPVVLFIGTYYKPNIEAAGFIIEKLAKSCPEAVFAVVGTVNGSCRDKVPVNVRLAGGVSDELLSEWLAAADIAINPMFSGSGMNMKMLDYFSAGLPVISTRFGLRGIEGEDFRDYLVSSPEDFAEKLRLLMRDPVLRDRLGKNARSLAEEKYDWEKISAGLADLLRGIKDR
jgi:glycosyltransferase involved in cell wall biosynthesis